MCNLTKLFFVSSMRKRKNINIILLYYLSIKAIAAKWLQLRDEWDDVSDMCMSS